MEEQKNYEKKYIWYNRSRYSENQLVEIRNRYSENVGLINACKIGILNKHNYVVHLSRVNGKEVLVVHSLIEKEGDIIEKLEDELARKLFNRLMFY